MLRTEPAIDVGVPLAQVWEFVSVPSNWAEQLPGYDSFEEQSRDDSIWTTRIGLGALVRVVKVAVHVTKWGEPNHVSFEFTGITEPISGSGAFNAQPSGGGTAITLSLSVEGSGPMSSMMEAMAAPVVPKLGDKFCQNLKGAIEREFGIVDANVARASPRRFARLRAVFARLFRRKASSVR